MTYSIDKDNLTDLFKEEVSRAAAMSFNEQGGSLYDHVHELTQDEGAVGRHIDDALDLVIRRFSDVATRDEDSIDLYLPDFDESHTDYAAKEITRSIVMGAVAGWLQEKSQPRAQEYASRSAAALDKAAGILRQRMIPRRFEQEEDA